MSLIKISDYSICAAAVQSRSGAVKLGMHWGRSGEGYPALTHNNNTVKEKLFTFVFVVESSIHFTSRKTTLILTRETSTGMRVSPFSLKLAFLMISLGSFQRTRKNPLSVTLKSWSFTFGISLMSIPREVRELGERSEYFVVNKSCMLKWSFWVPNLPMLTTVSELLGRAFLL